MKEDINEDIRKRFKSAWDVCMKERGEIKAFCDKYNIPTPNLIASMRSGNNRKIRSEWIACLCKEYRVCADYILVGDAPMFR